MNHSTRIRMPDKDGADQEKQGKEHIEAKQLPVFPLTAFHLSALKHIKKD